MKRQTSTALQGNPRFIQHFYGTPRAVPRCGMPTCVRLYVRLPQVVCNVKMDVECIPTDQYGRVSHWNILAAYAASDIIDGRLELACIRYAIMAF
jgi:hypothetical protein